MKLEVKDILLACIGFIALIEAYYLYAQHDKIIVQIKKEIVYKDRYIKTECPKLEKITIPTKSIPFHKPKLIFVD